jgi:hypothetical protein
MGDQRHTAFTTSGPSALNAKLRTIADSLPTLLLEANVVLGIQNRAAEIGILVDRTFVQARLARWQDAVAGVKAGIETLEARGKAKAS